MTAIDVVNQRLSFNIYMPEIKEVTTIVGNYDISLLQLLFCKNTVHLKECVAATVFSNRKRSIQRMDGCYWNRKLTQYF